jgi:hypothetical protein
MAVSDQLSSLSTHAKQAEDHVAAARGKAKAQLEADVKKASDSAQAQAVELRKKVDASKGKVSAWWDDTQRTWNNHIADARKDIDKRRAEHDLKRAQRNADVAEDDASFAIDFAYAAIDEAEYAVLDAVLARMQAEELAGAGARA